MNISIVKNISSILLFMTVFIFHSFSDDSENSQPSAINKDVLEKLIDSGKKVYNIHCLACHQQNGKGIQPVFPDLTKSSVVHDKDTEDQIIIVMEGKNAMPSFSQQLSDEDIAAVITYTRHAWLGKNDKSNGTYVLPNEITEYRKDN